MCQVPRSAGREPLTCGAQRSYEARKHFATSVDVTKSETSAGRVVRGLKPGGVGTSRRLAVVEQKCREGDWEVDRIVGRVYQGSLVSVSAV